ncbi:hypothetical protein [uncultured Sneathiella sp.]|uniref:hypothetical protein n=1 Tax=uncultured Sneathiella sp. TaxID=879315 RepID=UPI0025929210|nr:hypothetical protein [uncultured Sneathiella sp.]
MTQPALFTRYVFSLLVLVCVIVASPLARATSKEDVLRDALITNGQACLAQGDEDCAKACRVASDNVADTALVNNCHWLYRKASAGGSLERGDPVLEQMQYQGKSCINRRDRACAEACTEAIKDSANTQLVAHCNAEYQRVLAANPPPKAKPEESMTLAERIALMPDKAAYCKAKYSNKLPAGTRRAVDNCKRACLDQRVRDKNYPENKRTVAVGQCENAYYNVVKALGE